MCVRAVRNVDHPASGCRRFAQLFPRDLFAVLRDQPHCFWQHAPRWHPCAGLRHDEADAGQGSAGGAGRCRELYLAATSPPDT